MKGGLSMTGKRLEITFDGCETTQTQKKVKSQSIIVATPATGGGGGGNSGGGSGT